MDEILIFLEIVKTESLAAAGRSLGISAATVVRKLAKLERQLGVTLIERNTRRLSLTEHGRHCFSRCAQIPEILDEMQDSLSVAKEKLSGQLDISIASYSGYGEIMPMIAAFKQIYPKIKLNVIKTNIYPDLIDDNYDVYFRYEEVQTRSLRSDVLNEHQLGLCAHQSYLQKHGTPSHPKELLNHQCIVHQYNKHEGSYWSFVENDQAFGMNIEGAMVINNSAIVLEAVFNGAGIAYLPTYFARQYPEVTFFMQDFWCKAKKQFITYPRSPHLLAKTRLFVEHIKDSYLKPRP